MNQTIICPGCGHEFQVGTWDSGSCPKCEARDYYFDSSFDPLTGEEFYLVNLWY